MQTLTLVQFGKQCSVVKVTQKETNEHHFIIITNTHLMSLDEKGLIKDELKKAPS